MKTTIIALLLVIVAGIGVLAYQNINYQYAILGPVYTPEKSPQKTANFSQTPTPTIVSSPTPSPNTQIKTVQKTTTIVQQGQGGEGVLPVRIPVFATMNEANESGEYGTAVLMASDNDLAVISFNLTGGPAGQFQRAYIYNGTCGNIGSMVYSLQPLIGGSSTTTLSVDFLDITQSKTSLAIVVYSPVSDYQFPYSCGQLR